MSFSERLIKLAKPFSNTTEQKLFLDELDLEIDYWKAKQERSKDKKEIETINKYLSSLNDLRSVVSRDPKGLKWGYSSKKKE